MLAAGTMISVRKNQLAESLGLIEETRLLQPTNSDEEIDISDLPDSVTQPLRRQTLITEKNSLASVVSSSKSAAGGHSGEWRSNPVLSQLDKTIQQDGTLIYVDGIREKIYFAFQGLPFRLIMDEPWPTISRVVAWVTFVMVCCSVLTLCFRSWEVATREQWSETLLFSIDTTTIVWFLIDYFARLITSHHKLHFIRRWQNALDFITLIPYMVEVIFGTELFGLQVLRVVRLMRVMRFIKLQRHSGGLRDVKYAVFNSGSALSLLFFLLAIALTLFSTAMFYAEQEGSTFVIEGTARRWNQLNKTINVSRTWVRDDDNTISPFQSIFHTMWWCIVTMTTVGYGGNEVPVTPWGKLVGGITMVCGVFVIAFPTVILSATFHQAYSSRMSIVTLKSMAEEESKRMTRVRRNRSGHSSTSHLDGGLDDLDEVEMKLYRFNGADSAKARMEIRKKMAKDRVPLLCTLPSHDVIRKEFNNCVLGYDPEERDRATIAKANKEQEEASATKLDDKEDAEEKGRCSPPPPAALDNQATSNSTTVPEARSGCPGRNSLSGSGNADRDPPEKPLIVSATGRLNSPPSAATAATVNPPSIPALVESRYERLLRILKEPPNNRNLVAQNEDVVQHNILFYSPVFQLECARGSDFVQGRIKKCFPPGTFSVTFRLILDSDEVQQEYRRTYVGEPAVVSNARNPEAERGKALAPGGHEMTEEERLQRIADRDGSDDDDGAVRGGETDGNPASRDTRRGSLLAAGATPGSPMIPPEGIPPLVKVPGQKHHIRAVACKKLKTLKVHMHFDDTRITTNPQEESHQQPDQETTQKKATTTKELLRSCHLVCDTFRTPSASSLPLIVQCPTRASLEALTNNFAAMSFHFEVDYCGPSKRTIDLSGLKTQTVKSKKRSGSSTKPQRSNVGGPTLIPLVSFDGGSAAASMMFNAGGAFGDVSETQRPLGGSFASASTAMPSGTTTEAGGAPQSELPPPQESWRSGSSGETFKSTAVEPAPSKKTASSRRKSNNTM